MTVLAMEVAYKGTVFSGFARQPGELTVQGQLEHALLLLLHREVDTTCAGRTDTGVHARGQIVSFNINEEELTSLAERLESGSFLRSMNALTHEDIAVKRIWQAPEGFSARFDAQSREYRYYFCVDETHPVFMKDFSWHTGPLDDQAMFAASRPLIGEHDFKSFCKAVSAIDKPTCRNLIEISFFREELFGEHFLVMRVIGSSFLHSMVRTLAGTLVAVGRGRRDEQWVADVLEARDRTAAGECAPAEGLVFWSVNYE